MREAARRVVAEEQPDRRDWLQRGALNAAGDHLMAATILRRLDEAVWADQPE